MMHKRLPILEQQSHEKPRSEDRKPMSFAPQDAPADADKPRHRAETAGILGGEKFRKIVRQTWKRLLGAVPLVIILALLLCDFYISLSTRKQIYADIGKIPSAPVAIVLGTAKYTDEGRQNLFYAPRIKAAAELFLSGKVRGLIASGDNSRKEYNEPAQMKRDLMSAGVPARYITLDYAGLRTLDSVIRAKEVFRQTEVIFVSQKFHGQRAVFLANQNGIKSSAYIAEDPTSRWYWKARAREVLARFLAVMDVVSGREPRYLGRKQTVPYKVNFRSFKG